MSRLTPIYSHLFNLFRPSTQALLLVILSFYFTSQLETHVSCAPAPPHSMLFPECPTHALSGPGIPLLLQLANSCSSFKAQFKIVILVKTFKPCSQWQLMCKCSGIYHDVTIPYFQRNVYLYYTHWYKQLCHFFISVLSSFLCPLVSGALPPRKCLWFWSSKRAQVKSVKWETRRWSLVNYFRFKTERSKGDLGFFSRLYSPGYQTWKRSSSWVQKPFLEMNPTFVGTVLRVELELRVKKCSTPATRSHLINICYIGLNWRKLSDSK